MLTLNNILKVCPEQKNYQLLENKINNIKLESIYDRYIINISNTSLSTDSISIMLSKTINIDKDLYQCSLEKQDSFIRAILLFLADKHNITDHELFDIRRKLSIEIDNYVVKKSQKSKISDYLLSTNNVDKYEAYNVRKYISQYFDLITVIFDDRGSILEYYSTVNELTEDTPVLLLKYSILECKYYMIFSKKDKLKYEQLENLFNKLIKWNPLEGELILGLYNKKDMMKCISKIPITSIRDICSRYKITLIKPSDKSDKSVKKNKKELYEDLKYILLKR